MRYGDTLSFDITYNLTRERSSKKRQWGLGTFCGMAHNMESVESLNTCLYQDEALDKFYQRLHTHLDFSQLVPHPKSVIGRALLRNGIIL